MSKNVLVIGGAGFIGRHVCRALEDAGHLAIAFDKDLDFLHLVDVPNLACEDLFDSRKLIASAMGCDTVIHLAAHANVRWCEQHAGEACRVNIGGCRHLASVMMRASVNRIIYANSCAAKDPISVYGYTKRAGLFELREGAAEYDAEVISLRLANVYGPGEHDASRVVPSLIRNAQDDNPSTLAFNGELERDFVHVTDVAQAFVKAVEYRGGAAAEMEIGIGTGVRTSLTDLYLKVLSAVGRATALAYKGPINSYEPLSAGEDPGLASSILNWRPTITLDEGLRALCQEQTLT